MLTSILGYLALVGLIYIIAEAKGHNPWIFAGIAVVFTPITSGLCLFVYHNWIADKVK